MINQEIVSASKMHSKLANEYLEYHNRNLASIMIPDFQLMRSLYYINNIERIKNIITNGEKLIRLINSEIITYKNNCHLPLEEFDSLKNLKTLINSDITDCSELIKNSLLVKHNSKYLFN